VELSFVAAQAFESSARRAAEHHHYLDTICLEGGDFGPEGGVRGVVGVIVVEGDGAGVFVEVYGGEEDVGYAGLVGEEREEGEGAVGGGVEGLDVGC
jgi:hypothetical protein